MPFQAQNKVVLITDGVQGIGAAIAKVFAQNGAQVIVTDIAQEKGKAYAKQIQNHGDSTLVESTALFS